MTTDTFIEQTRRGTAIIQVAEKVIEEIKTINQEYAYYSTITADLALRQAEDLAKKKKEDKEQYQLYGLPISIKDCLCIKDVESTAGSTILKGYKPLITATAVHKLISAGAIVTGKTTQDEFGFGSFNTNGKGNNPLNPLDKKRTTGGSSGGGAGIARKAKQPHVAIVESTGGSISCPSAFCGVAGMTPTYGRISRYGLMDYGNSLDKIGCAAKEVKDIARVLQIMAGYDNKDSTSAQLPVPSYTKALTKDVRGKKVGVLQIDGLPEPIEKGLQKSIDKLQSYGVKIEKINLPYIEKYAIPAYYIIAMAEASTNLARLSGMRYGQQETTTEHYNEYFARIRSKYFNEETKRRILLGTFVRMEGYKEAYYNKALQIREQIVQEYKKVFKKVDGLISATMPVLPPKFTEIEKLSPLDHYRMDVLTVGPNLAGMPHISVNVDYHKKLPVGVQIIGNHFDEESVLQLGNSIHHV